MKTKTLLTILAIIVVASFVVMAYTNTKSVNGASTQTGSQNLDTKSGSNLAPEISGGQVQNAKLKMINGYQYVLEPATLKRGVPVRIEADMSTILGCMRTVVIKDFKITKTLSESNNIIEFTPDKTGTFQMTCSMGMGKGVFSVTDDGAANTQTVQEQKTLTTQAAQTGGTCGANGGGCGCGMMR